MVRRTWRQSQPSFDERGAGDRGPWEGIKGHGRRVKELTKLKSLQLRSLDGACKSKTIKRFDSVTCQKEQK